MKMKKEGNDLYDAVTAANLKESEKWNRKYAHVVIFCENKVFQIESVRRNGTAFLL